MLSSRPPWRSVCLPLSYLEKSGTHWPMKTMIPKHNNADFTEDFKVDEVKHVSSHAYWHTAPSASPGNGHSTCPSSPPTVTVPYFHSPLSSCSLTGWLHPPLSASVLLASLGHPYQLGCKISWSSLAFWVCLLPIPHTQPSCWGKRLSVLESMWLSHHELSHKLL